MDLVSDSSRQRRRKGKMLNSFVVRIADAAGGQNINKPTDSLLNLQPL